MAILENPPHPTQISALRGMVDIYCHRKRWVARAWPKTPKHPATPAQVQTWDRFRAAIRYEVQSPPSYQAAWRSILRPPHQSIVDLQRSENMRSATLGLPSWYLPLDDVTAYERYTPAEFVVSWGIGDVPPLECNALMLCARQVPNPHEPLPYTQSGIAIERQRQYLPHHKPDYGLFSTHYPEAIPDPGGHLIFQVPYQPAFIQVFLSLIFYPAEKHLLTPPIIPTPL